MNEYDISPRAFLQDYEISYINEIQYHSQEPFTGLQDIIYEKLLEYYKKNFFFYPSYNTKNFYCLIFNIPHFFNKF